MSKGQKSEVRGRGEITGQKGKDSIRRLRKMSDAKLYRNIKVGLHRGIAGLHHRIAALHRGVVSLQCGVAGLHLTVVRLHLPVAGLHLTVVRLH